MLLGINSGDGSSTRQGLYSFGAKVGRFPDLYLSYTNWDNPIVFSDDMAACLETGATLITSWQSIGSTANKYPLANIAAGTYDSYINTQASTVKGYAPRSIWIRFDHEMNGNWVDYGYNNGNGNTPAQYVAAWQHVWNLFQAAGVTNAKWIWTPNVFYGNSANVDDGLSAYYPGDTYVDYVGLDGYNSGSPWTSFASLFSADWQKVRAFTAKPFIVGEMSCAESGGSKAAWWRQTLLSDVTTATDAVAVNVFDRNKTTDWRIDSSASSFDAFRSAIRQAPYPQRPYFATSGFPR